MNQRLIDNMAQFYSPGRRVTTRQTISVTATDLDAFGQGVARHKGKAIFIPGLLPEEQAEVVITEDKRQFSKGKIKKLLIRSPQRVVPRCPHFSTCGGCQQQHASEALQHQSKRAALQRLIARETGVNMPPEPVIAGPEYGYRRRARFSLQYQPQSKKLIVGFHQSASHNVIDVKQCPILVPQLEQLLLPLDECLSALPSVKRLGHAELVLADNGPLLVLRHLDALTEADRQQLGAFAARYQVAIWLAPDSETLENLCGEAPYYEIDGLRLQFSPRDFIQVNDSVSKQMVRQAVQWLDIQPDERVLDLFCGMGNFTLPLAKCAKEVVGVEGVTTLVANAQYNARINLVNNVSFFHANLEDETTWQQWATQSFEKVLLDPARAGAPGMMPHIATLAPKRVVYVSCNPATLARDSKILLEAGYRLAQLRMLDMFPHTGHLESMALFINQSEE